MRKKLITPAMISPLPKSEGEWLDLEEVALVEVTSENPNFPIESGFGRRGRTGLAGGREG